MYTIVVRNFKAVPTQRYVQFHHQRNKINLTHQSKSINFTIKFFSTNKPTSDKIVQTVEETKKIVEKVEKIPSDRKLLITIKF